jgi:hypothetical protein
MFRLHAPCVLHLCRARKENTSTQTCRNKQHKKMYIKGLVFASLIACKDTGGCGDGLNKASRCVLFTSSCRPALGVCGQSSCTRT